MTTRIATACIGLVLLAGCGGSSGDLLALDVTGGPAGGGLHIRLTGDGRASCNGRALKPVTSKNVVDGRDVERRVKDLARDASIFGAPDRKRRNYVLRTKDGTVRWVEGEGGLPMELSQATLLELQLERVACRS